jgi:hypothetical protein
VSFCRDGQLLFTDAAPNPIPRSVALAFSVLPHAPFVWALLVYLLLQPFVCALLFATTMFRASCPSFVHEVAGLTNGHLLKFLRDKGVMASAPAMLRNAKFQALTDAEPGTPYAEARDRLGSVMRTSFDKHSHVIPQTVQQLSTFLKERPMWRRGIHPIVLQYPVQRVQRSGSLCYMHAPLVVQHYRASMCTNKDAGMIDMAAMIHDTWGGDELADYIFRKHGGNAYDMLKHVLAPRSIILASDVDNIAKRLKQFGPGLVTMFEAHAGFRADNTRGNIFDGHAKGPLKGLHAMALIGARTDAHGKRWFLLQNWWPGMQFVEVSASYLKSSLATVYFVETPQRRIPKSFPQYKAIYAESADLDREEFYSMRTGPLL